MTNIILFRAQPFHNGHLNMIKKAYDDAKRDGNRLFIFIGSADKFGTARNPFPVDIRIKLVKESLKEFYIGDEIFNPDTNIIPLNDLSDEANNTYTWGTYLYQKIKNVIKDEYITFYYCDRPEIMLSWFDEVEREYINFKFLARHKGFSATEVRSAIKLRENELLKILVPTPVYEYRETLREYLMEVF